MSLDTQNGDFELIEAMLNSAEFHGLLVEVVASFGQARAAGMGVHESASFALMEWDL